MTLNHAFCLISLHRRLPLALACDHGAGTATCGPHSLLAMSGQPCKGQGSGTLHVAGWLSRLASESSLSMGRSAVTAQLGCPAGS